MENIPSSIVCLPLLHEFFGFTQTGVEAAKGMTNCMFSTPIPSSIVLDSVDSC